MNILASDFNQYGMYFLFGAVGLINLSGLAMVIGMSKDFTFKIIKPAEEGNIDDTTPSNHQS